jgi:hypothetical protein
VEEQNPTQNAVLEQEKTNGPPLPEGGLPEGWTEDQWMHYGQQYLEAQTSYP